MPTRLAELGWHIHLIAEEFPDDAQDISDEAWIAYGLERGWHPLCKDGRIKTRAHERQPLVVRLVFSSTWTTSSYRLPKWCAESMRHRMRSTAWPRGRDRRPTRSERMASG
ncbi:hypothetical protein OOK39_20490 [Streptomyces sp. NBC_00264]|uniref:PIN-like domain-containing protein n=1 Tax=unclassified Streptomyces TaxID=2593676 RepID=UPI00225B2639|nr:MULTISPECIES: hypothetical protein [unclassified Streptomyces]MCX5161633.1 hypothetical protein [Streptomyces sp. NBC_00305]MCX5220156.1 hypothetical protein [Streptomyces sp. NBC_00264]